jgi:hypothetical protein
MDGCRPREAKLVREGDLTFVDALDSCRSEHARDGSKNNAGCQAASVIVDVHRQQARSHRGKKKPRISGAQRGAAVML